MTTKKKATETEGGALQISPIKTGTIEVHIRGTAPLIFNALSEKTRHELLLPAGKRTSTAARAATLKHDPAEEYRNSVYRFRGDNHLTRLTFPAAGFKRAMANAALDIEGAKKAEVGRLLWIDEGVEIFGIPQLLMSVVRSSDIARTPDIRSRAILGQWACCLNVHFVMPKLTATAVVNLLMAAGLLSGIGDWRQQKGSANYGQFVPVPKDDQGYLAIVENDGRAAQDLALASPGFYDVETEQLYGWFSEEIKARGRQDQLRAPQFENGTEAED